LTDLAIATSNIPGDLPTKLEAIAAAGFGSVELDEADLIGFNGTPTDVKFLARELGLKVEVFQPGCHFTGPNRQTREAVFARLDQKITVMKELGARTLLVSGAHFDARKPANLLRTEFARLADHVAAAGCRAAISALPWAQELQTDAQAFDLVQSIDHPNLGLALNSFFSLAGGAQAARLRDITVEKLFHVQLMDAPKLNIGMGSLKGHSGLLPGQGELNLASFIRVIARTGYSGPWSIGCRHATVKESNNNAARDGYRALVSLLDEVAQTEPSLDRPIPDLPQRVAPTGVEFIEFAASQTDKDTLTQVLRTLRFRRERVHASKSVELWRQGAINLVINSDKEGFAAQSRLAHGPGVCDMGLRVKDADQTVARAKRLGAPEFEQSVGSEELDIPAIKGVGGSVVHFIDEKSNLHRVWDIEFDPVPKDGATQPAGLRRIDHVAQTMRYQDMQTWLTYYLTTFVMEKASLVDVLDPAGVILSQAISSPEGEVRLNLNGAGERQTFAGAFLSQGFEAGVQHIAFQSDDIFETSRLLEASNFKRLTISPNYYSDLKSGFDLEADTVALLQAGNILYDRDERGEYFQIYSAPIWSGFFFEIVQRKHHYQGYGARNAPIRLAAQFQQTKDQG
jgi:4-hydroxyphenylpyruvate dioxygenase